MEGPEDTLLSACFEAFASGVDVDSIFAEDVVSQFLGTVEQEDAALPLFSPVLASDSLHDDLHCEHFFQDQQHATPTSSSPVSSVPSSPQHPAIESTSNTTCPPAPVALPAPLPPACFLTSHTSPHYAAAAALLRNHQHVSCSHRGSCKDSDDSDDMDADDQGDTKPSGPNKRKAPEVDWRAIEDPAERRRQRRLAKNRVTAARSRERKKLQWSEMEARIQELERENSQMRDLLAHFMQENTALKDHLMGTISSVPPQVDGTMPELITFPAAPSCQPIVNNALAFPTAAPRQGKSSTTEPAVLILIAILLVLSLLLPGDQAALAGSAIPMVLAAKLLHDRVHGAAFIDALFMVLLQLRRLCSDAPSHRAAKQGSSSRAKAAPPKASSSCATSTQPSFKALPFLSDAELEQLLLMQGYLAGNAPPVKLEPGPPEGDVAGAGDGAVTTAESCSCIPDMLSAADLLASPRFLSSCSDLACSVSSFLPVKPELVC